MVSIQFIGGVRTVTGSKFLVQSEQTTLLIESGLYQGLRELRDRNWEPFPIDPASIDAVLLTHAHLDHCGYLPRLFQEGFSGKVFLTTDTGKLAEIILRDSAKMQVEDAEYAERKGYSKHAKPQPLYDLIDAESAIEKFSPQPFHHEIQISSDATLRFLRGGHILGSAIIDLKIEDKRILFSGDLGRPNHPILSDPDPIPEYIYDALLVESTYGDRRHLELGDSLAEVITRTAKRGGSVLIPAFAVDRTEIILHRIKELFDLQLIPHMPVYLDSPMALASLDVYREAIEGKALDIDPKINLEGDPFNSDYWQAARSVEQSKALASLEVPSIIISASGMATGGRVIHHLKNMLPDSRNSVILVGYQSIGTRGRLLLDGVKSIKMFGSQVPVNAEIAKITEFSVHADSFEMIQWLKSAQHAPKKVFIVHGELEAGESFKDLIAKELSWKSEIPDKSSIHQI